MTTMTIAPEGIMAELIEQEAERGTALRQLTHEDGSVTVVHWEEYSGDFDPRTDRETSAQLVSDSSDYVPLDEGDHDIELMRDRCADFLGRGAGTTVWSRPTGAWRLHFEDGRETERRWLVVTLNVSYGGGTRTVSEYLDLDDYFDRFIAASFFLGHTAEEAVRHYIEQARPDIAHYEHHWQVAGSSQGDWREGWGYVTVEDVKRAGFYCDGPRDARDAGKQIMEGELKEYRAWFAGEVYRAVHIAPAGQEYEIGPEGGYYTGETLGTTEHCGGFIGYDNLADIGQQFTSSPVVEEEWV